MKKYGYRIIIFFCFISVLWIAEETLAQEDGKLKTGYYIRFPIDTLGARNFAPIGGILNVKYKYLDIGTSLGFLYINSPNNIWKVSYALEADFGVRIKVDLLSSQNSSVFLSTIPAQYTIGKVKFFTYNEERELTLSPITIIMYRAMLLGGSGIRLGNFSFEFEIPLIYFIVQRTKHNKRIDYPPKLSSIFDYPFICIYNLIRVF